MVIMAPPTPTPTPLSSLSLAPPNPLPFTKLLAIYVVASCYRLFNAFILQTQFDPDEYWQTLEPAYCLAFSSHIQSHIHSHSHSHSDSVSDFNCAYTWEWTRKFTTHDSNNSNNELVLPIKLLLNALHGPVRSHVSILPTYWFYKIVQYYSIDTTYIIAHGPVYCNAILVAAPTDVAIYCIARWVVQYSSTSTFANTNKYKCDTSWIPFLSLIASLTNWFNGYALVRTYSNSMETMLLTVGISLLCPDLFGTYSYADDSMNNNAYFHRLKIRGRAKIAFILGGLGVCVRFTSLAAWIPIGCIISFRYSKLSNGGTYRYFLRDGLRHIWNLCAIYGALGLLIGCVVDWYFYGTFGAVPFLGNFHFNVILGNGSLYGTHPPYWYFVAGLPAISGILLPFFIHGSFSALTFKKKMNRLKQQEEQQFARMKDIDICWWHSELTLLLIVVSYVSFHSVSAHKEFRFILPILPLVCILSSFAMERFLYNNNHTSDEEVKKGLPRTESLISKRKSFALGLLLFLLNYPHLFYLSLVHQRSPVTVNEKITHYIMKLNTVANRYSKDDKRLNQNRNDHKYTIHYLMGCHSTPLYSHLHIPTISRANGRTLIDTWTLDCSPSCRRDSSCESDFYSSNPYRFVLESYFGRASEEEAGINEDVKECIAGDQDADNETCNSNTNGETLDWERRMQNEEGVQPIPDFFAIFPSSEKVQDIIENKMGLFEVGKFLHGIKSVEISPNPCASDSSRNNANTILTSHPRGSHCVDLFGRAINISLEYMVLFARNERLRE